jgi:glutamine synthetase
MTDERRKANTLTDAQEMAEAYCNTVKPYFEIIRNHCDKLELLVDNELWTLTKYRELCLQSKMFSNYRVKAFL